jgi:sugar phosphate isomerase/epimerase
MMITSVSNLAWKEVETKSVIPMLKKYDIQSVEFAPSKLDASNAFTKFGRDSVQNFKSMIEDEGLYISSMQSILYGMSENMFGSEGEVKAILERFKVAIELADSINCRHIVFGSPRNRTNYKDDMFPKAVDFFGTIEAIAATHNVVIGIEGNSKLYGNTFLTNASEVFNFVNLFQSAFLKCNFDFGNEVMEGRNGLDLFTLKEEVSQIQISLPDLTPVTLVYGLDLFLDFCFQQDINLRTSLEMLCEDLNVLESSLKSLHSFQSLY